MRMNCFCVMVDRQKAFSLILSRNSEPEFRLCTIVITTTPPRNAFMSDHCFFLTMDNY